jgi:hypothetical protein
MKIDGHQGFVKGVTWDPVGQFLATQVSEEAPGELRGLMAF